MATVWIHCGTGEGPNTAYRDTANELGQLLSAAGIRIIYGGSARGLGLYLSEGALSAGGDLVGIMPDCFYDQVAGHTAPIGIRRVADMPARKQEMLKADAFIALPGGIGSLDEVFEAAVDNLMTKRRRPIILLGVDGYYDKLAGFLAHCVETGFCASTVQFGLTCVDSAFEAVRIVSEYVNADR